MPLAAPERLLAALLERHPAPLDRADADRLLRDDLEPARRELVERGHVLSQSEEAWALACGGEHFDPQRFERERRTRLGAALEVWERATSTNDLARHATERGAPAGSVWLSEQQTHGRGREQRTWSCRAHAGLLVSWLLRPPLAPEHRPTLLPLALGLGACEALRDATGLDLRTKWPNDLLRGERKVAGLLLEARQAPRPSVIAGFGLNVRSTALQGADLPAAASLDADDASREALLAILFEGIERRYEQWLDGRGADLVQAWLRLDAVPGRTVRVSTPRGVLDGRAVDITPDGLLRLETRTGTLHELAAGEVHLL